MDARFVDDLSRTLAMARFDQERCHCRRYTSKPWQIRKNASSKDTFNRCRRAVSSRTTSSALSLSFPSIVKVRETRLTVLISHIFIGLSLFMRHVLKQIPMPVLDGLFLYLALTSLDGNQFFERVSLFFTEQVSALSFDAYAHRSRLQAAYPPNHYIRQVPQRKIHLFTVLQLVQLVILCALGFSPILYTKLILPIWLVAMVAFRYQLLPKIIAIKYLRALDQRL